MDVVALLGRTTPRTPKTVLKGILCDHFLTSAFLFARVQFGDTESSKGLSSEKKQLPNSGNNVEELPLAQLRFQ